MSAPRVYALARRRLGARLVRGVTIATLTSTFPHIATAQTRLTGGTTLTIQPSFDSWSFGKSVVQPSVYGDSLVVHGLSQTAVSFGLASSIGDRWQLTASTAFASSRVQLNSAGSLGARDLSLSGLGDIRLTATFSAIPDHLLFTFGGTIPTGKQTLPVRELEAFRILAAPALGSEIPVLGTGSGGTAGIVMARELSGFAWAFGASYEVRNGYKPFESFGSAVSPAIYNPSDAVHLTLGIDRPAAAGRMTMRLSSDIFTQDQMRLSAVTTALQAHPGAIIAADWQYTVATARFENLTVFVADRYRMSATVNNASLSGTSGNYLDAGVRTIARLDPSTRLSADVTVRKYSGFSIDRSFASAGTLAGSVSFGVSRDMGSYSIRPFVRGQIGELDQSGLGTRMTRIGGGLALSFTK